MPCSGDQARTMAISTKIQIIMVTVYRDHDQIFAALKAGAIVRVGGTVGDFNGRPDLKVEMLRGNVDTRLAKDVPSFALKTPPATVAAADTSANVPGLSTTVQNCVWGNFRISAANRRALGPTG